jgi:hypothetical protein
MGTEAAAGEGPTTSGGRGQCYLAIVGDAHGDAPPGPASCLLPARGSWRDHSESQSPLHHSAAPGAPRFPLSSLLWPSFPIPIAVSLFPGPQNAIRVLGTLWHPNLMEGPTGNPSLALCLCLHRCGVPRRCSQVSSVLGLLDLLLGVPGWTVALGLYGIW